MPKLFFYFFLEQAGDLHIIVLIRKKKNPYRTPQIPKKKLQITFAPRQEKDEHNLKNTHY
jgi:hypothetical protein